MLAVVSFKQGSSQIIPGFENLPIFLVDELITAKWVDFGFVNNSRIKVAAEGSIAIRLKLRFKLRDSWIISFVQHAVDNQLEIVHSNYFTANYCFGDDSGWKQAISSLRLIFFVVHLKVIRNSKNVNFDLFFY